jgi:hypothetical protein
MGELVKPLFLCLKHDGLGVVPLCDDGSPIDSFRMKPWIT